MPYKCCVPGCRGNFINGPKVKVFSFPKEIALKNRWLGNIKKKNFLPSKHSRVCELHFFESDIQKEVSMLDFKTGKIVSAPLCHPKLNRNAIPSIFPKLSSHAIGKEKKLNSMNAKSQAPSSLKSCNVVTDEVVKEIGSMKTSLSKSDSLGRQQVFPITGSPSDHDVILSSQAFITAIETLEKRTSVLEEQLKRLLSYISYEP